MKWEKEPGKVRLGADCIVNPFADWSKKASLRADVHIFIYNGHLFNIKGMSEEFMLG